MQEIDNKRYAYRTAQNKPRFFIYAPPLFTARKSKRKPPNKPFREAEKWQTSVYYFWWAYLRRSKAYERTCANKGKGKLSKLYADFGNVFTDDVDEASAFKTWWNEHAHLFWEAEARHAEAIDNFNGVEDTDLVVRLALEVRTTTLVKQVRRLLAEHEEQVKKARAKSRAKYPVQSKVKLEALAKHLRVYDIVHANNGLKLWEVADEAGLLVSDEIGYYDEDGNYAGKKRLSWLLNNGYDAYAIEGEKIVKRRKTQLARQHLKAAEEYIANVELGKFPLRSK